MTEIEMSEILSEHLISEEKRDDGAANTAVPVPQSTGRDASDDAANANDQQQETAISGEDISYSARSFTAVMWPVAATMLIASFITVALKPDVAVTSSPYTVYAESASDTGGQKLGKAVLNALVIIGVVGGITFGLVALFYFKCYKVIYVWLSLSFLLLLGWTGQFLVTAAFTKYAVAWDMPSLYFFFWNFAAIGVYAIFVGKGTPRGLPQGYLVAVSVIEAWLVGRLLPEWSSWAVLVAIALYDLCAVLSPCGPLKWLLKVAARDGDELTDGPMRGMLYSAPLDDGDDDGGGDDGGDDGGCDAGGDEARDADTGSGSTRISWPGLWSGGTTTYRIAPWNGNSTR